jgi:hypothetical protein
MFSAQALATIQSAGGTVSAGTQVQIELLEQFSWEQP